MGEHDSVTQTVTLCNLALASTIYNSFTPFNRSLARLSKAAGGGIDLANSEHRVSVIEWLNEWGCRFSKDQHEIASDSILKWYQEHGACLFPDWKPIWALGDEELETAATAYGSLKEKTREWNTRSGSKISKRIGPTAASKILFAIRRKAAMPWDEAMRKSFKYDDSHTSYFEFLKTIRRLTSQIGVLCGNKGFQIDDLPKRLGRPNSTVLALVNEYIWVTVTRKCELPSSQIMAHWVQLG